MRLVRLTGVPLCLASILLLRVMTPRADAGETCVKYRVSRDSSIGYAVPIQHVFQFPAALVFQPTSPTGYAVPIQRVHQFPAAFVFQPGPEPPFGGVFNSAYDQYAGPSFIPR
jgi:hypothetical protein